MAKYINAERLKDSMFAYYDCLSESANGRPYKGDTLMDYEVVDMIEDCIDNAPTADVAEVKHGRWLSVGFGEYWCSVCDANGEDVLDKRGNPNWKHCSNCGAKMDE